jgi:hypothetical protein
MGSRTAAQCPYIFFSAVKAFFHAFHAQGEEADVAFVGFFDGCKTFFDARPGACGEVQEGGAWENVFRAHDVPRPGAASLSGRRPGGSRRRV